MCEAGGTGQCGPALTVEALEFFTAEDAEDRRGRGETGCSPLVRFPSALLRGTLR